MLVMVYGTLMMGFENHKVIKESMFISKAKTRGKLYHLPYGYPAIIEGDGWVKGEVYQVDETTLRALDLLEDYTYGAADNEYNRVMVQALLDSDTVSDVFIYMYANVSKVATVGIPISNGDWALFVEKNSFR
ncbi:MAG: gamma-glutamylcyclotransferase [Clostridia bacterium]|nr:gamma-glutamylcyclotransferase [Clostridia bacterium]